eukprot:jgi/Chrzof1/2043/UNPLg00699.t1
MAQPVCQLCDEAGNLVAAHKILSTVDDQFTKGCLGHQLKMTCQPLLYLEVDLFAFTTLTPPVADTVQLTSLPPLLTNQLIGLHCQKAFHVMLVKMRPGRSGDLPFSGS